MEQIFLGLPRYKFRQDDTGQIAAHASQRYAVGAKIVAGSLTCRNCNRLLCQALNARAAGFGFFAMLHDDIRAEVGWLDKLMVELQRVGADFLSAVVPYKNNSGLTSTSICLSDGKTFGLTQAQVRHPDFPETFDAPAAVGALARLPPSLRVDRGGRELWCNTGCMVCRIDRDWEWTKFCFQQWDGIALINGEYREWSVSEDFVFSAHIARAGGKVCATRLIDLEHYEESANIVYRSTEVWGQPRDEEMV
jgi:hypothetical protein